MNSKNQGKNLVAPEDRVPFFKKLAYAFGGPVDILSVWILVSIAYQVFNMELGLAPTKVAIILMMLRLWDGIADPVMGWISDNTRTRWGRRRPYILVGGLLTGLTFPLLWWFPESYGMPENHNHLMTWVIGFGVLFYTSFTIWAMPYQSLLMEMTPDYNERTRVTSVRSILQSLASFFVGCSWWVALRFKGGDGLPSAATGMRTISLWVGAVILVLAILPAIFVKERYYEKELIQKQKRVKVGAFIKGWIAGHLVWSAVIVVAMGALVLNFHWVLDFLSDHPFAILPFFFLLLLLKNVREALRNAPFRNLAVFTVLFLVGTSIFDSYGRYVGTYYVLGGDKDLSALYQILGTTTYMVCSLMMIPVFRRISERIGKPKTLAISVVLVLVSAMLTWFTFNPAYPVLTLINTLFIGAGYAGLWLMIPSMQIDVVDDDELKSGIRREGTFAAVFSWILKLSFCFGFLVSGPLIEYAGFDWALTNQAGWFGPWVSSVKETPDAAAPESLKVGYVEVLEADVPKAAEDAEFNGFKIAYVYLGKVDASADLAKAREALKENLPPLDRTARVAFAADPDDVAQPATGFRNVTGIGEDDPLDGARVGYVALKTEKAAPNAPDDEADGAFSRFVGRLTRSRERPKEHEIDEWIAYAVVRDGAAPQPGDITLGRLVVPGPMPGIADPLQARLDANQPPSVYRNMRIGYIALPVGALLIAMVLLHFFPITPERAREIREQLETRRGKV